MLIELIGSEYVDKEGGHWLGYWDHRKDLKIPCDGVNCKYCERDPEYISFLGLAV